MSKDEFKILDDISHVLLRPAIYIGSTTSEEKNIFLNFEYTKVTYNPGLFKIINELIDNSIDEHIRTEFKFATKIDITMDSSSFSITDNGRGIPVDKVSDVDGSKIYRPEAAWCRTKAGSNFNSDSDRVTAGMNGVGSALSNIFSTSFIGETSDGKNKFVVKCSNNAKIDDLKVTKSTKKYTKVIISPDFARFGLSGFDETIIGMVKDRLYGLSVVFPTITFKFNDESLKGITPRSFVNKFGEDCVYYSDDNTILGIMPSTGGEMLSHSIVNGLTLYSGGSHEDFIMSGIVQPVREYILKKYKFDVMPAHVKSHLKLVSVIKNFKNMKFDSQTKERLTNTKNEVADHLANIDFATIAKNIVKNENILMPIIEAQLAKQQAKDAADERKRNKQIKNLKVAKHISATHKDVSKKTLYIMEGDSACGQFLLVRDVKTQGALPLRGKILNTFGKSNKDIIKNNALAELMTVIGVELGKPATEASMNYGTIAIMTDQDLDGGAIRCQLINFFYNWPELFKEGRVKIINSPIYILRGKTENHYFYTKEEYEAFKGSKSKYEVAYIKGLGSLRMEEYRYVLENPYYQTVQIDDESLLEMMYGEDSNIRKKYMME